MMDMFPIWTESLATGAQLWVAGLLILVLLLILMYLLRNPLRYWREGRRITQGVKRLGARMLRNVNFPDGMGGEISIDFLMLSTDAILVIGVRRYDGMIFGGAQTDEWTQTINSRSYKFPNPDNYLLQQVSAVKSIVPETPVKGMHLFTDNALFPWDKPSNVLQVKDLRSSRTRRPKLKNIPAELRAAWTQITRSLNQ
ncbi:MAG: nuclease-related domain-containing protein [Pseudomonadota bacterium]